MVRPHTQPGPGRTATEWGGLCSSGTRSRYPTPAAVPKPPIEEEVTQAIGTITISLKGVSYQKPTKRGDDASTLPPNAVLHWRAVLWNMTHAWTGLAGYKQRCWRLNQVLHCWFHCPQAGIRSILFCSIKVSTRCLNSFLTYHPHLGHFNKKPKPILWTFVFLEC